MPPNGPENWDSLAELWLSQEGRRKVGGGKKHQVFCERVSRASERVSVYDALDNNANEHRKFELSYVGLQQRQQQQQQIIILLVVVQ